jgi:hypothetical protein
MCGSGKEKVGQTGRRRRKERSEILGLLNSSLYLYYTARYGKMINER